MWERTAGAVWGSRGSWPFPHPAHPRPRALGLLHRRMLPKMVICVRGRECGFPRFRVTWRERDSLAGSPARHGLPPSTTLGRGAGRGPRERPQGPRRRVLENNHSPEERDRRFGAAPPRGWEPGAQSHSQGRARPRMVVGVLRGAA